MSELEHLFPGLIGTPYQVTSPRDKNYNCIAWAAGDTQRWWWPGENADREYWPPAISRVLTQEAFIAAFATLGYVVCDSEAIEGGYQKIALFADDEGPSHASRQLSDGRWSSKMGELEDIEHLLHALEGTQYGSVILVMKRIAPQTA